MSYTSFRAALTAAATVSVLLTGCGSGSSSTSTSSPASTGSTTHSTASSTSAAALTLTDGWAKSAAKGEMTAMFGTLHNAAATPVKVTGATSSDGPVQLHETVMVNGTMQMRQVSSFTVPAHGQFVLKPGGNHIMFMSLPSELKTGQQVTVTLSLDGGASISLTVPVRPFTGANETYSSMSTSMSPSSMSMSGH